MLKKRNSFFILVLSIALLVSLSLTGFAMSSGSEKSETTGEVKPVPEGHVRIHYYRFDDNYSDWGLHVWGNGYDGPKVSWDSALSPAGRDDFGVYWDVPYAGSGDLNYIIHKGDTKDVAEDQSVPNPGENKEIWVVSSNSKEFLSKEATEAARNNQIQNAAIKKKNLIILDMRVPLENPADKVKLTTDGKEVPLKSVVEIESGKYAVSIKEEIDYTKPYKVEVGELNTSPLLPPEKINENYSYDGELGAIYTPEATTFKVWSPVASNVELLLFDEDKQTKQQKPDRRVEMERDEESGLWTVKVEGDLAGQYYQYAINNQGTTKRALDPYAKSMDGFNSSKEGVGMGAVVDLDKTDPEGWQEDEYVDVEDPEDVVIYEMSVRDYTIDKDSGVAKDKRGTYDGFIDKIPHLKELGITHVQLMPVLNFYNGNEFDQSFEDKGHGGANYNWGYDPHNYFTPEGWYSQDPTKPHLRIKELKRLITELHKHDIGVMLDVVYNHTYKISIFNNLVPKYYYRYKDNGKISNGSGCGNTTESRRKMMRKLIVDSTTYWTDEYHVDGFRFDLMGLHDEKTMMEVNEKVKEVNPDAVIHGEGWNMSDIEDDPAYVKGQGDRSLLEYEHAPGVFSDSIRDSIHQPSAFAAVEKGAFIQGVEGSDSKLRAGVIAGMAEFASDASLTTENYHRFSDDPEETTSYVTCHDGYTLWDKINLSAKDASEEEKQRMHKLGSAIILTSQGRGFLHGGVEMLRTKPVSNRDHPYDHNSYDSGDSVNQVDWSRKEDYSDIVDYHQGLIDLKLKHEAFRMETMEEIQQGVSFYNISKENLVAYKLQEQDGDEEWKNIVVIYNGNRETQTVDIPDVNSDWKVVVDGEKAGVKELTATEVEVNSGSVKVPAISAVVLHN